VRECSFCGAECSAQIGAYRELKTAFWGGGSEGRISYSPKMVMFFCNDEHRSSYLYPVTESDDDTEI
jgi:hypothetical protein